MKNDASRWIAAISLLSLFAIIACAGTRSTGARQTTQNVLVTNTSSQPVQVASRPGTGAYIVSVANAPTVKVASSPTAPVITKDVNNPDANGAIVSNLFTFGAGVTGSVKTQTLSALPTVIDEVSVRGVSNVSGETIDEGAVGVFDSGLNKKGDFFFAVQPVHNSTVISAFIDHVHIPVPAGGIVAIDADRNGGSSNSVTVLYTIAYHTVPNP